MGSKLARAVPALLAVMLAGCGGGGGDSQPGPAIHVQSQLDVTSLVTKAHIETQRVTVTTSGLPDTYQLRARYTKNGITQLAAEITGQDTFQLNIDFPDPYRTRLGIYRDTIQLDTCSDEACSKRLSPTRTIEVTFTVQEATGADAPRLTFSQASVDVGALITDIQPESPVVGLAFTNVPVIPHMVVTHGTNALERVLENWGDNTSGQLILNLKPPSQVTTGVYTDTITVELCLDPDCINPFPERFRTLEVRYTVTGIVEGPQGYQIQIALMDVGDIVADPVRERIYVAQPDAIALLDPTDGTTIQTVPLGASPGVMAISDDGQFLYVDLDTGIVQRFVLPDVTPDISINLGVDPIFGFPLRAKDIQVAPGLPHTVAIARRNDVGLAEGTLIFDDAVARPTSIPRPLNIYADVSVDVLQWGASAAVLYGASWINQDSELYELSVDASGVQVANTLTGIGSNFEWLHYAQGLLYLDRGKIIDPAMGAQTGALPFNECWFYCRVVADAELDRIFVANVSMPGFWSVVQIYDIHTLDSLGHAALPYQSTVSKVVRWGDDGLAMSANTEMGPAVILLEGPLIAP